MANLSLPPPNRIAVGSVVVNGQRLDVLLNPEWGRYFESLNTQVNTTGSAVGQPGAPGTTGAAGAGVSLSDDAGESMEFIPGPRGEQGPRGDPGPALFMLAEQEADTPLMMLPAAVPASSFTGTLGVANGGTGDTGTAWTTYTPTVTSGTGAITTLGAVTGRYKQLGQSLFLYVAIPITTNGTSASYILCTLPPGMTFKVDDAPIYGREANVSGKALTSNSTAGASTFAILNYDNTYPGSTGARLIVRGVIEIA